MTRTAESERAVDETADELLRRLRPPVRAFLGCVLRDDESAEEAAADTWVAILERHRRLFRPRDWTAYALRVAWSQALRVQRDRRRASPGREADETIDGSMDPRRLVELRELLERSLGQLEPIDRALLHLRFEQDLGHAEIGRVLGWPAGTVKRRVHEARARLLAIFERLGVERANLALCALWPRFGEIGPGTGTALQAGRFLAGIVAIAAALRVAVGWIDPPPDAPAPAPDVASVAARIDVPSPAAAIVAPRAVLDSVAASATEVARTAPAPTRRVAGLVVNDAGAPVPGAPVHLFAFDAERRTDRSTVTDALGRYAFDDVPRPAPGRPDEGVLEVRAEGFAAAWRRLATVATPAGDVIHADLFISRPGVLVGRVIDADSFAPIAAATVSLWANLDLGRPPAGLYFAPRDPVGPTVLAEADTGWDGRYEIAAVPTLATGAPPLARRAAADGIDTAKFCGGVTISAPGYAPQPHMLDLVDEAGARAALDVALFPAGSVSGRVVDERGRPVPGVLVAAGIEALTTYHYRAFAAQSPGGAPWRVTTDEDGRFLVDRLPCRRVAPTAVRLEVEGSDRSSAIVTEAFAGLITRAPDLVLRTEVPSILGARWTDGAPVAGARAVVVSGDAILTARTDAGGRIALAAAPRSAAFVRIVAPGGSAIAAPTPGEEQELVLDTAGPIVGRVVATDGRPLGGVRVIAAPAPFDPVCLATLPAGAADALLSFALTDELGRFRLADVPAGPTTLFAARAAPGGAPLRVDDLRAIAAVGDDRSGVEVSLPDDGGSIRGTLALRLVGPTPRDVPRRGMSAWIIDPAGVRVAVGTAIGPGRILLPDVPVGPHRLFVEADGYLGEETLVEVPPGDEPTPVTVTLQTAYSVTGTIVVPDDVTADAHIGVIAEQGSPPRVVGGQVAADGRFEVAGLARGAWRVLAYARDPGRGRSWSAPPLDVELQDASYDATTPFTLTALDTLEARLEGVAASNETASDDPFLRVSYALCRDLRLVVTDASGRLWFDRPPFAFGGAADGADWVVPIPLPAGPYTIKLVHEDGRTRESSVSVPGTCVFDAR